MSRSTLPRRISVLLLLALLGQQARGATYTVTTLGGGTGTGSLGSAVTSAAPDASTSDTISFSTLFDTSQTITLTGSYPAAMRDEPYTLSVSPQSLLTLQAGNYTAFTVTGDGRLSLSNISLQGTGIGLSLGTNTVLALNNTNISDGIHIAGADISVPTGQSSTFSGPISGYNGLDVAGGTLVLSSTANTYTGVSIASNGGTLSVSNDANLGASSATISLNNGTLETTAGITSARAIALGSGGGTILVDAGQTSSLSGAITGNALTVSGPGTLVLGGTNSYTGGTFVNGGGVVSISGSANLGNGDLTLSGSTLQTTGTLTPYGVLILAGTGGTIDAATAGQTATLDSVSGSGGLTITGPGTVALNGSGGYTGGTLVTGGSTVAVSRDYSLGASTESVTLNNGTLQAGSGFSSARAITLGTGGGTISTAVGQQTALSGAISGAGSLAITGGGEISLSSTANSYVGTSVTGGSTVIISSDTNLGYSGGGLTLDDGTLAYTSSLTSSRTITLGSGGATLHDETSFNTATLNGHITGTGALTVGGMGFTTVVLGSSLNDYAGGTTVGFGATLLLQNGTTAMSGTATGTGQLTVQVAGALGGAGTSHASSFNIQGQVTVGNGTDVSSQTTLTGTTASTFSGARLSLNLGSGMTQGQSNTLNLGSTPVTFNNTTLTLNMLGTTAIQPDTSYTLITTNSAINPTADGLTLGTNGQITAGLTIGSSSSFGGGAVNGYTTGSYGGSYLFIDGDDVDVEVVPEPGVGSLLLTGCGLLFLTRFAHSFRRPPASRTDLIL